MNDTIHALSSGLPPAGVAVIRISGPDSFKILHQLLRSNSPITPRSAMLRSIYAANSESLIDRGLVLTFPKPHSFTGEDVVELQLHGSPAVVAALFNTLSELGSRPAEAGEFTRRAFLNGQMDLTQAEALADLISAETEAQRALAIANSGGRLREQADNWREKLIHLMAEIEADLDFSDEGDVEGERLRPSIGALAQEIAAVLAEAPIGERIRQGLKIAIIGPPNAGKSSLLNALARRDVAIVTPIAGTTRDSIEVHLDLAGRAAIIIDTAGLRETDDIVEREGISRAEAHATHADLILDLGSSLPHENKLHIINKIDETGDTAGIHGNKAYISAKTGAGLTDLEEWLTNWALSTIPAGEPPLVTHARHKHILGQVVLNLEAAEAEPDAVLQAELLRQAATDLGRLTGRIDPESVLDHLFGQFCIGK